MFNAIAMILLVYMGWRDERRPPGSPPTSIFRTRSVLSEETRQQHRRPGTDRARP
jgi:hypothetical protein